MKNFNIEYFVGNQKFVYGLKASNKHEAKSEAKKRLSGQIVGVFEDNEFEESIKKITLSEKLDWLLRDSRKAIEFKDHIKDSIREGSYIVYDNDWEDDFKVYFEIDDYGCVSGGGVYLNENTEVVFSEKMDQVVLDWMEEVKEEIRDEDFHNQY